MSESRDVRWKKKKKNVCIHVKRYAVGLLVCVCIKLEQNKLMFNHSKSKWYKRTYFAAL